MPRVFTDDRRRRDIAEVDPRATDAKSRRPRRRFGQADGCDLRIGEDDGGDRLVVGPIFDILAENCPNGDSCLVLAHVRECREAVGVADCVEPGTRNRRDAQAGVDGDGFRWREPEQLKVQRLGSRPSSSGDQQFGRRDDRAVIERHRHGAIDRCDFGRLARKVDDDALRPQRVCQQFARERLRRRQEPVASFDDRHFARPESLPRLRQLDANGSASQDGESLGH